MIGLANCYGSGGRNNASQLSQQIQKLDEKSERWGIDWDRPLQQLRDTIREEMHTSHSNVQSALDQLKERFSREENREPPVHAATMGSDDKSAPDEVSITEAMQHTLSSLVKDVAAAIPALLGTVTIRQQSERALSTLYFDDMRLRQENIKPAHCETYTWIFRHRTPEGIPTYFADWLKTGDGIFWIRGKAGSGKSTLMKFIVQHETTIQELRHWAGEGHLVIGGHFFWNSGSKLQMSQIGLLRSLLFDILRHCPDEIPELEKPGGPLHVGLDSTNGWTKEELLLQALEKLAKRRLSKRFCFFIDGLDEYDGEHDQLIGMLEKLTLLKNVKVCVSSRPWTCFIDAFGGNHQRMLKLEDLTIGDIRQYVQDSFDHHLRLRKRPKGQTDALYDSLVEDVVQRAQGVFLWVFLVVRSLKSGLAYADRLSDLQRRIETLPPDLESFFRHILQSVDEFYREQSSEIFLLSAHATGPLPAVIFSAMDEIDENPSELLSLSLTTQNLGDVEEWRDCMARRLDARTKGLLEMTLGNDGEAGDHTHLRQHLQLRVEFLHRTVHEFLIAPDMERMLREKCRPNFNPSERLC